MAFSLLTSGGAQSSNTLTATTAALDTTGAKLLVVFTAADNLMSAVVTDSKGNTWTSLVDGTMAPDARVFYCANATVGTGHTFTVSNGLGTAKYPSLAVQAFAVDGQAVFDQETRNQTNGTTYQPGSQTPSANNALVVQGISHGHIGTPTLSAPYTITYQAGLVSLTALGVSLAYHVQTTATATNPTWTNAGFAVASVRSASFTEISSLVALPPAGALTLAGQTPTVTAPIDRAVPAGALILLGRAPSLAGTTGVPVGALVLSGLAPGQEFSENTVPIGVGGLVLTGQPPTLINTSEAAVGVGALVITGYAPTSLWITEAHVSALAIELPALTNAGGHVSQLVIEYIPTNPPGEAQVSQLVIEVLRYFTEPPCVDVHPAGCPVEFAPPPAGGGAGCVIPFDPTGTVTS